MNLMMLHIEGSQSVIRQDITRERERVSEKSIEKLTVQQVFEMNSSSLQ
jgi:hypothetical protein